MNIFRKKDGAVTIFLILILVPVLALTGIFVELSRIELAKPIMTSSADLALNTALTNYDQKLKEYYGLMGSAQNTKDTADVAEEYFKNCINSQVVDQDQLDLWWKQLTNIINNGSQIIGGDSVIDTEADKVSNLLLMNVSNLAVEPVVNANLYNPVFLQSQIVEFMKYRAPIELTTGLFDRLKSQHENLKNLEKDSDLQYKEKETYEAENALLQRLYDIYCEVQDYQSLGINASYISEMNSVISGEGEQSVRTIYSQIHKNAVRRYINVTTEDSIFREFRGQIWRPTTLNVSSKKYTSANCDDIKSLLAENSKGNALSYIQKFEEARAKLQEKISFFTSKPEMEYPGDNQTDSFQYSLQLYRKAGVADAIKEYFAAAKNIWTSYEEISKIYEDAYEDEELKESLQNMSCDLKLCPNLAKKALEEIKTVEISNVYELLETVYLLYGDYERYQIKESAYKNATLSQNRTLYILNLMIAAVQAPGIEDEIGGAADSDQLTVLHNKLSGHVYKLTEGRKILKNIRAMVEGQGSYAREGSLTDLVNVYSQNLNDWNNSEEYATAEGSFCQESKGRAKKAVENKQNISQEDIDIFTQRITGIDTYLNDVIAYIKTGTTYNGKPVYEIVNLEDFVEVDKNVVPPSEIDGVYTHQGLKELAENNFPFIYGSQQIVPGDSSHPDIAGVEKPNLYAYMQEKFKDADVKKDDSKGKNIYEKYKNDPKAKADQEAAEETDSANDILTLLKSLDHMEVPEGTSGVSFFNSLINLAGGLFTDFEGTITDARDELYVTEYCMQMFSYASYESEMKYRYMQKNDIKLDELEKLSGRLAESGMVSKLADSSSEKETISKLPQNEELEYTDNKSLTNKLINADNNYAYQREIEYILFGGKNSENIKNVKQELFKVRYALNLIPGYKLFWGDPVVIDIAAAVSSATAGIVPEPLVRVVMILLMVGLESWNDVELLEEGVPVKLLKFGQRAEDAEWVCNTSTNFADDIATLLAGEIKSEASPSTNSVGDKFRLKYSDYLTLLLYFQLTSGDADKVNNVYKRIGCVIQTNMSKMIYQKDDYRLSNCITQYSLNYAAEVSPLMFQLGIYNGYNTKPLVDDKTWRTIKGNMVRGY